MIDPLAPRGGRLLSLSALGLAAVALLIAAAATLRAHPAARPAPVRVPRPDDVLTKVDPFDPTLSAARAAANPGNPAELRWALASAERMISASRRQGDPRFLGRAQAVLAPWWDAAAPPDEVLLLRATIRQGLHDFTAARADLDLLIGHLPDEPQALLTRAVVAMVQGDLPRATADCTRVGELEGELLGVACAAPLATRGGHGRAVYDRLGALLAETPAGPVVPWALSSRGELARTIGDDREAERLLRAALVRTPDDPYTEAALADLLLDAGRDEEVDAMLRDTQAETLMLRRAIALHRLGKPEATELTARLRAGIEASAARGDNTHLRERARFFLDVDRQPALALAAALGNWQLQREPIDVRTLLDAAAAAHDPAGAAPALAWIEAGAIDDVVLAAARARLEEGR